MFVLIEDIINTFFPKFCPVCGKKLKEKESLCTECRAKIGAVPYAQKGREHYERFLYREKYAGEMGKIIRDYKFVPRPSLSNLLSDLLLEIFEKFPPPAHSVLTYVPPTFSSLKQKGFNHMKVLCEKLSKKSGIPCINLLEVRRERKPQVGGTFKLRMKNVRGKYAVKIDKLYKTSGNIVVLDDVFTTGATVEECARLLKMAGATEIWVCTLARS